MTWVGEFYYLLSTLAISPSPAQCRNVSLFLFLLEDNTDTDWEVIGNNKFGELSKDGTKKVGLEGDSNQVLNLNHSN